MKEILNAIEKVVEAIREQAGISEDPQQEQPHMDWPQDKNWLKQSELQKEIIEWGRLIGNTSPGSPSFYRRLDYLKDVIAAHDKF